MLALGLALMFPSLAKLILERALAFAGVCMDSCTFTYASFTRENQPKQFDLCAACAYVLVWTLALMLASLVKTRPYHGCIIFLSLFCGQENANDLNYSIF